MSEQFDISVVISTYNRCDMLPDALASVLAQDTNGVRYELIVVDNNSTDQTRRVVESFIAQGYANLRYVFEGQQGLSHARNTGIANARAPIISFTDDDVRIAPNWIALIKRAFDDHPEVDFVGGKVLPRWESEPPAWLTCAHWSPLALSDYGDDPFYVNAERQICLVGANLSFRREVFKRVGLFAPDLQRVKDGIGSTEDHEFLLRLWRAGRQGLYVPGIVVVADVQSDRLKKAYHRRWHKGNGRFCAMMRINELVVRDGEFIEDAPETALFFGTPAFIYRALIHRSALWLAASVRRPDSALEHEMQMRYLLGYMSKRYEQNGAERKRSPLVEIGLFAKTLLLKKSSLRGRKQDGNLKLKGSRAESRPIRK